MAKGKAYSKQSVKKTGRERKENLVAEIVEKLDNATGLVFTEYKGITHQQLESLRKELKSADASLLIAKNSLMKISMSKSQKFADHKDNESLAGSAATLFIGNDTIEPLKKLQKSIKDTGLPTIKFGILEGQLLDEAGVIKLASLPTREVLLAQFVGMLNAPIQGFVTGLNAIPQKFVMTLDAIAKIKPAGAVQDDSSAKPASDSAVASDTASEPTPSTESPSSQTSATEEPKEDEAAAEVQAVKPADKSEDEVVAKSEDAVQNEDSAEASASTEDKSNEEKPTDEAEKTNEENTKNS